MSLIIPNNYQQKLPGLLHDTKKWTATYFMGSNQDLVNTVSFHTPQNNYKGNIILIPGIGTNTNIDPLMLAISYWALTHKYNLFCINTFINKFKTIISEQNQPEQNWSDYTDSLHIALEHISYTTKGYTCIIGHSAGATGLVSTLNQMNKNNQQINFSSIILFAPFVNNSWYETLKQFSQKNHKSENLIFLANIFNQQTPHMYIPITYNFFDALCDQPFEPEIMSNWGIPTTIIAGEKDKKATPKDLYEKYKILQTYPNGDKFNYIEIPNTKHNFLNIPNNKEIILQILHNQRKQYKK